MAQEIVIMLFKSHYNLMNIIYVTILKNLIGGEPLTSNEDRLTMPESVSSLLYGAGNLAVIYISETIAATREINSSSLSLIIDMLVKVTMIKLWKPPRDYHQPF